MHTSVRIDKILIVKLERIVKKISYEHCDYESVDKKSLSKPGYVSKNYEKKNSGTKGLIISNFQKQDRLIIKEQLQINWCQQISGSIKIITDNLNTNEAKETI